MRILDARDEDNVIVRDAAWLAEVMGECVQVDPRPEPTEAGWVVLELWVVENKGCQLDVSITDGDGAVSGERVARWWPDVTLALPVGLDTWRPFGVYGASDDAGHVGFGMGRYDAYDVGQGQAAVSEVWVEGNSERVRGLGWVKGTGHRHVVCAFHWQGAGDEPPAPGMDPKVAELVCQADAALLEANYHLKRAGSTLEELKALLHIRCID